MNSLGICKLDIAIIAVVVIAGGAAYAYYAMQPAAPQQVAPAPKPAPQPQYPAQAPAPVTLQRFKASGYTSAQDSVLLIRDVASDRGILASNGLDPEWISLPDREIRLSTVKTFLNCKQVG